MADFDELELLSPEELLLAQITVARAQVHEVELKLEMTIVRRRMTWLAACALLCAVAVAIFVLPFVSPQLRELAPAVLTFCAIGLYAVAVTYVQQESQRRFFGYLLQRLTEALGDANDAMGRALTLSGSKGDYA